MGERLSVGVNAAPLGNEGDALLLAQRRLTKESGVLLDDVICCNVINLFSFVSSSSSDSKTLRVLFEGIGKVFDLCKAGLFHRFSSQFLEVSPICSPCKAYRSLLIVRSSGTLGACPQNSLSSATYACLLCLEIDCAICWTYVSSVVCSRSRS